MKTALAIITSFCRLSNLPIPSTISTGSDPSSLQVVEALLAALKDMRQAACWDVQKRKYSFSTEASRTQYPLPADFYKPIPRSHYNQSTDMELIQASDYDMGRMLYADSGDDSEYSYRIFGPDVARTTAGQLELHPTPSSVVTLSFEYYSGNLVLPATWTSSDYALYESITAETDLVPFDADIAELGLKAKFRDPTGGDWQSAEAEFQKKISAAASRLSGNVRGSFAGRRARNPWDARARTPYRGWDLS